MKLRLLNEYGFAPGASLNPKRDEQIQFNRHKASTAPAASNSKNIPPIMAGASARPETDDPEYDEDMEYDDVTEAMWHLREMTGNMVTLMDVSEFLGMDPRELLDITARLAARGRIQGDIDNGVETVLDHDDLRPLLTHIFGIL